MTVPERFKNRQYSAVDLFGQDAVDWQDRVNFSRLRAQRLDRMRHMMKEAELSVVVLFTGENIRYATGAFQGHWKYAPFIRYAIVPLVGEPYLFELANIDYDNAVLDLPWLMGRIRPAIAWRMTEGARPQYLQRMVKSVVGVLGDLGIKGGQVGLDYRDLEVIDEFSRQGYSVVDGQAMMLKARVRKLPDELELLKQGCAIGDACFHRIKYEWLKPGVREREIVGEMSKYLFQNGFEHIAQLFCATGGGTNPYKRWFSDKLIRSGDFVIIDINAAGPGGYYIDFVRTLLVGNKATPEQRDSYKRCHKLLQDTLAVIKAGVSTKDVAQQLPKDDDDALKTVSLVSQGHAIGLSLADGRWISRGFSLEFPSILEEDMVFAVETYWGDPRSQQAARLEDNIVVTERGCERFSLFEYEDALLE